MDRPLRPLFPKGFFQRRAGSSHSHERGSGCADRDSCYDRIFGSAGYIGYSMGWSTGSVLIGMVDGQFIVNPSLAQREESSMHLVVSGTKDAIMMVEAGANEVPEETILDAIMFAHEEIKKIVEFIEEIVKEVGKPKMELDLYKVPEDIEAAVREYAEDKMRTAH